MLRHQALVTLITVALAASAHAATVYVANNGVDGPSCGPKTSPCRSISLAVNTIAADGDIIVVGPGRYGDLNNNGTLGDSPGEETGGFGCMVLIGHAVTVTSSNGAGATTIDARSVPVGCNVGIIAYGTQFGKPGKGFEVTQTKQSSGGDGLQIDAANVVVSGNQVITDEAPTSQPYTVPGSGIHTIAGPTSVLIEGNQVIGWTTGIRAEADPTKIEKNEIARCARGIEAGGTSIVSGDVLNDNDEGMLLTGQVTVTGNALLGNTTGIFLAGPTAFAGTIQKTNFIGDRYCGIENFSGAVGVPATNNYWGAATGPGAAPADQGGPGSGGCDVGAATTTVTPFATKPFNVKAPIKP